MRRLPIVALMLAGICAAQSPEFSRGIRACASCHPAQSNLQPQTSMAHALESVAECEILRQNPSLHYSYKNYDYKIERKGSQSTYTVTGGGQTFTAPIQWAMGMGFAGQTYIYEANGELYQSRVSFYNDVKALDLTLGAEGGGSPISALDAAGRIFSQGEKLKCFSCHATNAVAGKQLTLEKLSPGIQCERCHGPSEAHLTSVQNKSMPFVPMKKLRTNSAEETSNFCGQCHRTWADVAASGAHGIQTIRFQPFGLTSSKCFDTEDKRISCTACHDPHQEIVRDSSAYDAPCRACHSPQGKVAAKICHVAKTNCATCHMPKSELPGSHHQFTDHRIQIVKTGKRLS